MDAKTFFRVQGKYPCSSSMNSFCFYKDSKYNKIVIYFKWDVISIDRFRENWGHCVFPKQKKRKENSDFQQLNMQLLWMVWQWLPVPFESPWSHFLTRIWLSIPILKKSLDLPSFFFLSEEHCQSQKNPVTKQCWKTEPCLYHIWAGISQYSFHPMSKQFL